METLFNLLLALTFILFIFIHFTNKTKTQKHKLTTKEKTHIKQKIQKTTKENNKKTQIIELDKLLSHTLTLYGYKGTTYEKIKQATPIIKNIKEIKQAHQIRNKIAHEINYEPTQKTQQQTLKTFLKTLNHLLK